MVFAAVRLLWTLKWQLAHDEVASLSTRWYQWRLSRSELKKFDAPSRVSSSEEAWQVRHSSALLLFQFSPV